MNELLLPRTDAGVFAQVIGVFVVFAIAIWLVRRNRDLVHFVVGIATLTIAFMGLRAVH